VRNVALADQVVLAARGDAKGRCQAAAGDPRVRPLEARGDRMRGARDQGGVERGLVPEQRLEFTLREKERVRREDRAPRRSVYAFIEQHPFSQHLPRPERGHARAGGTVLDRHAAAKQDGKKTPLITFTEEHLVHGEAAWRSCLAEMPKQRVGEPFEETDSLEEFG